MKNRDTGRNPDTTAARDSAPRPLLGVLSDETGPSLAGCIDFCTSAGLDQIEIRMVDGIPPLSLTDDQARAANAQIRAAGLTVSGLATPLLKWAAPGRKAADQGDQFGFARDGRSDAQLIELAIRIADLFETPNLRIFSYLTHDGFEPGDLQPALDTLLDFAERHDKTLRLENEPVCNIARFDQLAAIVEAYDTPRLEALPDIGNSAGIGEFPSAELIARVMAHTHHIHFKDWSDTAAKFVPLGSGVVRLDAYLREIRQAAAGRQLSFSLETHTHDDPLGGTRASAARLAAVTDRYFANP